MSAIAELQRGTSFASRSMAAENPATASSHLPIRRSRYARLYRRGAARGPGSYSIALSKENTASVRRPAHQSAADRYHQQKVATQIVGLKLSKANTTTRNSSWCRGAYQPSQGMSHAGSSTSQVLHGPPRAPSNIQQPQTKIDTLAASTPHDAPAYWDRFHASAVCERLEPAADRQQKLQPAAHQCYLNQALARHPLQSRRPLPALGRALQLIRSSQTQQSRFRFITLGGASERVRGRQIGRQAGRAGSTAVNLCCILTTRLHCCHLHWALTLLVVASDLPEV